ncbi:MAG: ankyrin repeat domain-containing protein, partial [Gammaproteobacteria bacterium]
QLAWPPLLIEGWRPALEFGRSREAGTRGVRAPDPAAVEAIRGGDLETLKRLLAGSPGLATERVDGSRTLLHVATDWPGHFPNAAASVTLLITHGADVNARFIGPSAETPLHWAASSDDVAVLDALLDHGADIDPPGAVIGGGTPLADAVAFGQWQAARRLVRRGARTTLWQAAALGRRDHPRLLVRLSWWPACDGGGLTPSMLRAEAAPRHWRSGYTAGVPYPRRSWVEAQAVSLPAASVCRSPSHDSHRLIQHIWANYLIPSRSLLSDNTRAMDNPSARRQESQHPRVIRGIDVPQGG